jgi:hypothetical protein
MRILALAATAAILMLPVAGPANACAGASLGMAQATALDLSAAKKAAKKTKKKKKEKVQYMRAAPMK